MTFITSSAEAPSMIMSNSSAYTVSFSMSTRTSVSRYFLFSDSMRSAV